MLAEAAEAMQLWGVLERVAENTCSGAFFLLPRFTSLQTGKNLSLL